MASKKRSLEERIEDFAASSVDAKSGAEARRAVKELLDLLERGEVRAAENRGGRWRAVPWVKKGILLGFRVGRLAATWPSEATLPFTDKDIYLRVRRFGTKANVRVVPGGSSIRRGTYVAQSVVCMPPMYINVGAYVDEGTMVDSHALIGSCAQIGKRVHVSAAAQIGGVLEPVNAAPVVIEDDVLVGGNCGVYEGTIVHSRAVLAAGVILTRGTPVFDLVKETVYRASADQPLEIPEAAVVVPGARAIQQGWGAAQHLGLQAPIIVKYRDEKTDLATTLESWLR